MSVLPISPPGPATLTLRLPFADESKDPENGEIESEALRAAPCRDTRASHLEAFSRQVVSQPRGSTKAEKALRPYDLS